MRNESFPVFAALLNAVHRGVNVSLLTNDYGTTDCPGMISPLTFLSLAGIDVRFYTSTTYIHAKYQSTDKKRAAVSSVNFSKASCLDNREAGVIIEGPDSAPILNYLDGIFQQDFDQAYVLQPDQTYSPSDMQIIQDTTEVAYTIPGIPPIQPGRYITPAPTPVSGQGNLIASTSPDFADQLIMSDITNTTQTITIYMYQVTSTDLCQEIINLNQAGITVNIMVSYRIYDQTDCAAANVCYAQLYNAGLTLMKAPWYYFFAHQKYWIRDSMSVGWSTGNWSPTDYPQDGPGVVTFPPFGQSGWFNSNRDFTMYSTNSNLISVFQTLYNNDVADGDTWTPQYTVKCGS
jgi:phosphatidylserine/phosphatidylglycerophosphate/cardiolipin synthase-like enzyme